MSRNLEIPEIGIPWILTKKQAHSHTGAQVCNPGHVGGMLSHKPLSHLAKKEKMKKKIHRKFEFCQKSSASPTLMWLSILCLSELLMGTGALSVYAVEWKCIAFHCNMPFKTLTGNYRKPRIPSSTKMEQVHNQDVHQILPLCHSWQQKWTDLR